MADLQPVAFACVAVIIAVYTVRWYFNPLRTIPTIGGSSLPGFSYIAALRINGRIKAILEEGYRKYPRSAFKFSTFDQWSVVVSGRDMVEDLRKRPDEELLFLRGAQEYVCEPAVHSDEYHVDVLKEKLTRSLPAMLPDLVDEVVISIEEHLPTDGNEWTSIEVLPAVQKIIARASNRAFVGLPLCRNEEYLTLAIDFAVDFLKDSVAVCLVPDFMKPIVALFISRVKRTSNRVMAHLQPIFEERVRTLAESSEGLDDKPNDVLQFIIEGAISKGESAFVITQRMLMVNFASIHTSSHTIMHVLYHLAEDPELLQPLREEIQACISSDGWATTAMGSMRKLDSILREALRYHGISLLGISRKAVKDITLRDGTRIPKGTLVSANAYAHQHDAAILEHADTFDAFRFARMRSTAGQSLKHQFTSTSPEYVPFGHGQHACPGRYFASCELKAVLGHIILNHDLKLPRGDEARAPDIYVGNVTAAVLAPNRRILFKKRGGSTS
ncbi:hypothetical protein V8D89_004881 [Ganoderma adspersum]